MQTLSVYFLQSEMKEIKEVVSTMNDVEILMEQDVPGSDLCVIQFLFSDPSVLFTIGLLVGINRSRKITDNIFKNMVDGIEKLTIKIDKP